MNYIWWREKKQKDYLTGRRNRQTESDYTSRPAVGEKTSSLSSRESLLWGWRRWVRRPRLNHVDLQHCSLSCQQATCVEMRPKVVGQVLIRQDFKVQHGVTSLCSWTWFSEVAVSKRNHDRLEDTDGQTYSRSWKKKSSSNTQQSLYALFFEASKWCEKKGQKKNFKNCKKKEKVRNLITCKSITGKHDLCLHSLDELDDIKLPLWVDLVYFPSFNARCAHLKTLNIIFLTVDDGVMNPKGLF